MSIIYGTSSNSITDNGYILISSSDSSATNPSEFCISTSKDRIDLTAYKELSKLLPEHARKRFINLTNHISKSIQLEPLGLLARNPQLLELDDNLLYLIMYSDTHVSEIPVGCPRIKIFKYFIRDANKPALRIFLKMEKVFIDPIRAAKIAVKLAKYKAARHAKYIKFKIWNYITDVIDSLRRDLISWTLLHQEETFCIQMLIDIQNMATELQRDFKIQKDNSPHDIHDRFMKEIKMSRITKELIKFDNDWLEQKEYEDLKLVHAHNNIMLVEEGINMDHCVGGKGYIESCKRKFSSIYGVYLKNKHIATLELKKLDGKISINQCRGKSNKTIEDCVMLKIRKLVKIANQKHEKCEA